jgi:ketosteroid isomerase-like protein
MRTRTPVLIVLLPLSLALTGCNSRRDTTAVRDATGVGPAVPVDRQAEEQQIRGLERRWREALAAKDSAAVGRFYAEDGFYLPQGSNGYEGPEKIRTRWAGEFSGGKFELKREPKKIEFADAGDMAYEVGDPVTRVRAPLPRADRGMDGGRQLPPRAIRACPASSSNVRSVRPPPR